MNLTDLKHTQWHYIHKRWRTPLFCYLIWEGASKHYNHDSTFPYETNGFLVLDEEIGVAAEAWEAMRTRILHELKSNAQFLINSFKDAYRHDTKIAEFVKAINHRDYTNKETLLHNWERYLSLTYQFGSAIMLPLFVETDLEERLREAIAKTFKEQGREQVFQVLTTPMKAGAAQEEELHLLQLALKQQQDTLSDVDITNHLKRFAWITNNAFNNQFMTKAELLKRLQEVKDPGLQLTDYRAKIKAIQAEFRQYNSQLNQTDQTLVTTLQESIYFRSWRSERYYHHAYSLQTFFGVIANATGVKEEDLFYLIPPEITASLKHQKPISQPLINERKLAYGMLMTTAEAAVWSGSELQKAKATITLQPDTVFGEIRGHVAYGGKATGPARVVISKHDLHKVQDGDVLVTPSTTVDYVPSLRKVVAIVTEEGGVLSHASVISRELHIPCVIGTKFATKAFKDGDMIEVDADNGIVRKL